VFKRKEDAGLIPTGQALNDRREQYRERMEPVRQRLLAQFTKLDPEMSLKDAWDAFWWNVVKRDLGLEGLNTLQAVDPVVFATERLVFEENTVETHRLQRRILGLLDFDRIMEERDFGVYRTLLEKLVGDLTRELDKLIENCNTILVGKLPVIEGMASEFPSLDEKRCWGSNVSALRKVLEQLKAGALGLKDLLRDKEVLANTLNEMRRINRTITDEWGSWQRRVKHGLFGAVATLVALLSAVAIADNLTLFSVVSPSEWFVANAWRIAMGGIASYILVRQVFGGRVKLLRNVFNLFDPEQEGNSTLARFQDQGRPLLKFKRYFLDRHVIARNGYYFYLYLCAIGLPAMALFGVAYAYTSLDSELTHVARRTASGAPCRASVGKTVFTFPTYKVVKEDGTGAMRLFYNDKISELSTRDYPECKEPADGDSSVIAVVAALREEIKTMQTSMTRLQTEVFRVDMKVETVEKRFTSDRLQGGGTRSARVGMDSKGAMEIEKLSVRLGALEGQMTQALDDAVDQSNANAAQLIKSLQEQTDVLRQQLCVLGTANTKAVMTGVNKDLRSKLRTRLEKDCGVDFQIARGEEQVLLSK
jgi:hypothetical protein